MPLPQKRRHRRSRPPREGHSRRRRGEDGASLSGPLVESDSSSSSTTTSSAPPSGFLGEPAERTSNAPPSGSLGEPAERTSSAPPSGSLDEPAERTSSAPPSGSLDEPPDARPALESRYHEILASRLADLQLRAGAITDDDDDIPNLPSDEIVQALTRSDFCDDELRGALVEYQVQKFLREPHGPDVVGDRDSGEDLGDDITKQELLNYCKILKDRTPAPIDRKTQLNDEQSEMLHAKYVRYRIKAYLLLKGKPINELDDATLESKYPLELALKKRCFSPYLVGVDGAFDWYFDSDLCLLASLSDYQRLHLINCTWSGYQSITEYTSICNTHEADRDYVLYWEELVDEIKWLENHVLKDSLEWGQVRVKGWYQAARIAAKFPNIDYVLASLGFQEYIWSTHFYLVSVKGLDRAFFEIWKRVNEGEKTFKEALREVCNENLVPLRQRTLKAKLQGHDFLQFEQLFYRCIDGISKELPDWRVQKLIMQEINYERSLPKTYAQYARRKLQIAKVLGMVPKPGILA